MSLTGLRERIGAALVRVGAARAAERRALVARIAALPAHTPGRDRALGDLAVGAWMESALLWLGWRLLPVRAADAGPSGPRGCAGRG